MGWLSGHGLGLRDCSPKVLDSISLASSSWGHLTPTRNRVKRLWEGLEGLVRGFAQVSSRHPALELFWDSFNNLKTYLKYCCYHIIR